MKGEGGLFDQVQRSCWNVSRDPRLARDQGIVSGVEHQCHPNAFLENPALFGDDALRDPNDGAPALLDRADEPLRAAELVENMLVPRHLPGFSLHF